MSLLLNRPILKYLRIPNRLNRLLLKHLRTQQLEAIALTGILLIALSYQLPPTPISLLKLSRKWNRRWFKSILPKLRERKCRIRLTIHSFGVFLVKGNRHRLKGQLGGVLVPALSLAPMVRF